MMTWVWGYSLSVCDKRWLEITIIFTQKMVVDYNFQNCIGKNMFHHFSLVWFLPDTGVMECSTWPLSTDITYIRPEVATTTRLSPWEVKVIRRAGVTNLQGRLFNFGSSSGVLSDWRNMFIGQTKASLKNTDNLVVLSVLWWFSDWVAFNGCRQIYCTWA